MPTASPPASSRSPTIRFTLNQGTLYPALVRLEQKGWIKGTWQTTENNREAKYYAITKAGTRALASRSNGGSAPPAWSNKLLLTESELMAAIRRLFLRLFNAFRPGRAERELAREMAAHLALLEDEFVRRGMPPDEARLAARLALGGVEQAKELHRDARSFVWLDDARRDVRYAVADAAAQPDRHGDGRAVARDRHRRQHRDLHRRQRAAVPRAGRGAGADDWWTSASAARRRLPTARIPTYLDIRRAPRRWTASTRRLFPQAMSLGGAGDPTAPERVFANSSPPTTSRSSARARRRATVRRGRRRAG